MHPSEKVYLEAADCLMKRYRRIPNSYLDQLLFLLDGARGTAGLIRACADSNDDIDPKDIAAAAFNLCGNLEAVKILALAWENDIYATLRKNPAERGQP